MMGIIMTVFVIAYLLGFGSYFACRIAYKEIIIMLDEEKAQKKSLSASDQLS